MSQPADEFKAGAVTVTIWPQDGKYGVYHKSTLKITYEKDGEFQNTDSIDSKDLLKAARLLEKAHDRILELENE